MLFLFLLICLLGLGQVQAKAVFAHFMVGNTASFGVADWIRNMNLAMEAHIDAFALNIAAGWVDNDAQIANAFTAADSLGFKLFFSFDYAGNGPWAESDVYNLIRTYGSNTAYYHYNGAPFVSTFEGTDNANDWITIKAETGCFFMPDWSSRGAEVALKLGGGVADGLFSWAAWAWGSWNMTTYVDASYNQTLNGKPYMMPVSPWFFTNLPGYKKNWLWRSDDLWYDRWQQVWYFQPEFVEIISWNDFGESHYIGPLDDTQYSAFKIGNAPYNYVENMPHDGWRQLLPYVIDTYRNGRATFDTEVLVTWYRPTLASACGDGGTTANTASQLQIEYRPVDIVDDRIFVSALLSEPAYLTINYGVGEYGVDWDYTPEGGVGIYHASMALNGQTGSATIQLLRDSGVFISYNPSQGISTTCTNDITNWNVWVGSATYTLTSTIPPPLSLSKQVCVQGWGVGNFEGLLSGWGMCLYEYGTAVDTTQSDRSGGLSSKCACSTTKVPPYIPTTSPFNPPACTGGHGDGGFAGLCSFACNYGYCPIHTCTCTSTGALVESPPTTDVVGSSNIGPDNGLCAWACSHGYCPSGACSSGSTGSSGSLVPTGWVSFGDSFSAGPGAGYYLDNFLSGCLRTNNSYPMQLNTALEGLVPNDFKFEFLACSGSLTDDTKMRQQRRTWSNSSNFGTITIGGNDAGFANVLIQCILQPPTYGKSGHWWSGETFDCEGELSNSQAIIDDANYVQALVRAYTNIFAGPPLDQQFDLFVAGYSRFFDTSNEADCGTLGMLWNKPTITYNLRQSINSLVLQVNEKIQQAVAATKLTENRSITYVDWDSQMDGHRFCTPGYSNEPIQNKYEAAHEYFFAAIGSEDNYPGEEDKWPPSSSTPYPPESGTYSFSVDPKTCADNLDNPGNIYDPDELLNIWCTWAIEAAANASFAAAIEAYFTPQPASSADESMTVAWTNNELVVTSSGSQGVTAKIFHPKSLGHGLIAKALLAAIKEKE
ncbi:mutanase Pc12g07500 [Aspergillus lentulus]|uniref:Mutanase Pc12g07500 n=1 Tax=Aspergillus lentulus TaxID=293939 RepID=A0ABQ0ZRW5_ASPLE|nr:mutanase Pc12g07500 [Aspergillus lentulus]GFF26046.1 mutanase Pc12g07500 [Aspergillus lentulus]GFF45229.1 mutanase Pc12g07500 [Aspergillus lentulus]GFF62184.1 mutanase Pc12g07500 [Aspergillus lentulus]GFG01084.1 mutanase Pc12g07500 [Aspergillus lentulus]